MKKNIIQLFLIQRSNTDITCYKNWEKFQLSIVDGSLILIVDDIEIQFREGVMLEIKNIYPDDNIKKYISVTFIAPDHYQCRIVEHSDVRQDKEENATATFMLLKSYLLPLGTYY